MSFVADAMAVASESTTRAVSTVQGRVLTVHRGAARLLERAPSPPAWAADRLRTVLPDEDLVVQAFRIQAQQLEATRRFTLALFETWRPVTRKLTGRDR